MEACYRAVFGGEAESDPFNGLVIAAGADWRDAALLRALASWLRQARAPFSPGYVAECLLRYPAIANDLLALFRTRFEPDSGPRRDSREQDAQRLRARIEAGLAHVPSLDDDRIVRRLLNLMLAIVRTNFFLRDADGRPPPAIAFKMESRAIDRLPDPKPYREIFVSSPRLEGVHLRFDRIARGGIRWSDRPQDFRTEVLGLAKAQQVKNTVIVPSGAKGGFVPRQMKRNATREETLAEGIAAYRLFIGTLLSLTDNIRDDVVVPPIGVVRHDGDDPYLVVAADKGTATFSDIANEIAVSQGFWLGDAFASGGSDGYDHKRIGITARGAWECVKRHFREIDIDIQTRPFGVVGVGDMSGDVFGNAMLLSPHTHLVAAFDHRDIFLDPSPDPAVSLAERQRLFALPRSSWQDFDKAKLSPGGGVYPRSAKAVPLSAEAQALLGVRVDALPPAELIQAILRSQTDLLWFGGIGTYVRASSETDDQVGDRANDALRIAADELRAKVVGEGANLGLTQRARIEAASRGVRLDTDFIDNSAGVNTSDQEVNIKLALAPAVASGKLAAEDRRNLLAAMTDDVADTVLLNNYQQSLALSLAERTSRRDIQHLARLVRRLEERGLIERKLEALPSGVEMAQRTATGQGLTRPELAVLLSWSKIALNADLLASTVPDDPAAEPLLLEYFPVAMREPYRAEILAHRLRREIIATRITNSVVNRCGPAVVERVAEATGRSAAEIAAAAMAARGVHALPELWAEIDALDARIAGSLQLDLYAAVQELLIDTTVELLKRQAGRRIADIAAVWGPAARTLSFIGPDALPPAHRTRFDEAAARLEAAGIPHALAHQMAGLDLARQVPAMAELAQWAGSPVEAITKSVLGIGHYLRIDDLRARTAAMPLADDYDRKAVADALARIESQRDVLVGRALKDPTAAADLAGWIAIKAPQIAKAKPMLDEILAGPDLSIGRLIVISSELQGAMGV